MVRRHHLIFVIPLKISLKILDHKKKLMRKHFGWLEICMANCVSVKQKIDFV